MTVLSYKENRFNLQANKIVWQKNYRVTSVSRLIFVFNFIILATIITGSIFYIIWTVQTTNYRLDIQKSEKRIQSLEEKSADLKIQLSQLSTSSNIDKILVGTNLIKENHPIYFAIQKSSTPISLNKVNEPKSE